MAQKESIIFRPTAETKAAIKNEFAGVFKVLPPKLDWFPSAIEAIKASSELSGSRWALFVETISVNGLTCFVSVTTF